jgi:hypothetical protein
VTRVTRPTRQVFAKALAPGRDHISRQSFVQVG